MGELIDEKLRYGRVEAGIGVRERQEILALVKPRNRSPFADVIRVPGGRFWFCEPTIRLPIEFVDFGGDGLLRRPSLCRFLEL